MKHPTRWKSLPVDQTRRYLEPGPVVLLSTAHRGERAIMTLGWHMMLGYDLVGTYIWQANRSHALARASRECVINLPTEDLLDTVARIGNCSSIEQDKFDRFDLTPLGSREVGAPRNVSGLAANLAVPEYATGVGAVLCGYKSVRMKAEAKKSVWKKVGQWFGVG